MISRLKTSTCSDLLIPTYAVRPHQCPRSFPDVNKQRTLGYAQLRCLHLPWYSGIHSTCKIGTSVFPRKTTLSQGWKCEFYASSVTFLGFILDKGKMRTDPANIKAVVDLPTPTSRKQLQCFLGFVAIVYLYGITVRLLHLLTKLAFIKLPFMVLRRRGSICQAKTIFPKLQFSSTLTSLFNLR